MVSGSVVAPSASLPMARVAAVSADATRAGAAFHPSGSGIPVQPSHGAGSSRWQRARLVLDQHQRSADAVTKQGQVLPVRAELADLLPQRGLRRGSTMVVRGSTTLLLALLAEATANGSWAAIVGLPDLGVVAAAELGVAVQRLALIPNPGTNTPDVLAALLDGIDLVAVAPTPTAARTPPTAWPPVRSGAHPVPTQSRRSGSHAATSVRPVATSSAAHNRLPAAHTGLGAGPANTRPAADPSAAHPARTAWPPVTESAPSDAHPTNARPPSQVSPELARRLSARARHRKTILIAFGDWPGADLELTCVHTTWSGLAAGHGHLMSRDSTITVQGRGTASRPTTHRVTLPAVTRPAPPVRRHDPDEPETDREAG